MERFETLKQFLYEADRPYDIERINAAYECARNAHEGQRRKSGSPYIEHPVNVAIILAELGMDTDCVCAGLLHDVVEDTNTLLSEIEMQFGAEIASLVDGLTKLKQLPLPKEEQQAENIRKMLLAMSQDIRVILIKLADRLHNMRTLSATSVEQQLRVSLETMEIYAPIAHRLGISALKEELEDLSLRYLDPIAVEEIEATMDLKHYDRISLINTITARIKQRLSEYHVQEPVIQGRVKGLYGIYRKVYMAGREFDEVYDIFAVRIIVNTDIECYNTLGIIHDMFRPLPNRFKDYISTPKPNMYQSLHTTVIGQEGVPFEIQIRTWGMHYTAEYGIAAHWKYKEGIHGKDKLEDRLAWIRRIIESQQDSEEDIVRTIKTDLTPEEVYVFTPRGDVKCLPAGSTVIDFAYVIHSEVGNKMIGAKVDGRIVSLEHVIKNGQIVEIITTKSRTHGPNKEWVGIAKTSEARSKIRSWFKKERREENILEGQLELERELKRNHIHFTQEQYQDLLKKLCKRYNHEENDLFAAIGYGGVILSKIMPRIKEDFLKMVKADAQEDHEVILSDLLTPPQKLTGDVVVDGVDNCVVKYAKCCAPLPGDDIIGFVSRGHGISVHKRDCVNVRNAIGDPEKQDRWLAVSWSGEIVSNYYCTLDIVARDREKLFADVSLALAGMRIPIHEISARSLKNGNAVIVATVGLQGVEHLRATMQKLQKISDVLSVERSGK